MTAASRYDRVGNEQNDIIRLRKHIEATLEEITKRDLSDKFFQDFAIHPDRENLLYIGIYNFLLYQCKSHFRCMCSKFYLRIRPLMVYNRFRRSEVDLD